MPEENEDPTKLLKLVELAQKKASYFKDLESRAFAKIKFADHYELYPLRSVSFENWLSSINYLNFIEVPPSKLKSDALLHLEGITRLYGKTHEAGLRVMGNEEFIEIDLGGPDWRSVYITKDGWKVGKHKNYFYRSRAMQSLPRPSKQKISQDWIQTNLNIQGDQQSVLIMGWLIGCFMPLGPNPLLVIQGEQGSGKSLLASMIRSLVDPAKADKTSLPSSERDLYVQAQNNYVLSFDNQRTLYKKHSDWLCRMATGGGYSTRRLYTNTEEEVFSMIRPIILNGITQVAEQPDLIDRSIFINMPVINPQERRSEREIFGSLDKLKPKIFGKICDSLVSILGKDDKENDNLPRMADFAKFVSRAEEVLEWENGSFIDAMNKNRQEALEELNEYDPLLNSIMALSRKNKRYAKFFLGTPAELFNRLMEFMPEKYSKSGFPDSPATLSKKLNGLKPVLRELGIEVIDKKSRGKRLKRIEWMDK